MSGRESGCTSMHRLGCTARRPVRLRRGSTQEVELYLLSRWSMLAGRNDVQQAGARAPTSSQFMVLRHLSRHEQRSLHVSR
eukprot:2666464-Alexandrium_andersonii.AAC.1